MSLKPADVDRLDFGKGKGLIPAVVQHADTGSVLMIAYMNREALHATLDRRRVVFWSRSEQRLWEKGETSGNTLHFVSAHVDCDNDALLILARPLGPACHLGMATCFGDERRTHAERLAFMSALERVIERRVAECPDGSYTARLFSQGGKRIAQKVGEEGLEVAIAGAAEGDDDVIAESADLLYHLLVLLQSRGLRLEHVVAELQARHEKRTDRRP